MAKFYKKKRRGYKKRSYRRARRRIKKFNKRVKKVILKQLEPKQHTVFYNLTTGEPLAGIGYIGPMKDSAN